MGNRLQIKSDIIAAITNRSLLFLSDFNVSFILYEYNLI